MLTFPTRCIYINVYLLVMAEWKSLDPDVSARRWMWFIYPPKVKIAESALTQLLPRWSSLFWSLLHGPGYEVMLVAVQHVWIYKYAMCYTIHVREYNIMQILARMLAAWRTHIHTHSHVATSSHTASWDDKPGYTEQIVDVCTSTFRSGAK